MSELWQVQVNAYWCMGRWVGAVVVWTPRDSGTPSSTQLARFQVDTEAGGDLVDDVLAVLEHAHISVTDAANAST